MWTEEFQIPRRHYRNGNYRITIEPLSVFGGSIARLIYRGHMIAAERYPKKPFKSWTHEDFDALVATHKKEPAAAP